jgi:hypothetical protein
VERLSKSGHMADAEEAVLRRLAELRQAVVDGINQAPDLNALRTILKQLFEVVLLVPSGAVPAEWSGVEVGDYLLLPILRDEMIIGREGPEATAVQRAVLPLESAQVGLHR